VTWIVLPAMIGVSILLGLVAVGMLMRDVTRRRDGAAPGEATPDGVAPEEEPLFLTGEPDRGRIDQSFRRLVQQSGTTLSEGAVLALVIGAGVVGGAAIFTFTDDLLLSGAGVVLGVTLPILVLYIVRWRRFRQMRAAMPETLDTVADAIRSGRTLQHTFKMVAEETNTAFSDEFEHAAAQLELGHSPVSVLNRMVRRLPLAEFRIFATAVLVHRQAGGNLALLTERLANSARDREQFHGHLGAVTAGSRFSAIGLVFGSIIGIVVLGLIQPTYVGSFFTNPYGLPLLAIAGTLELIGILWVWRILKVQY